MSDATSAPLALEARFTLALPGFHLSVELTHTRGILALFGPSGAGKTLTLRALAGLERLATGSIAVGGRPLGDATTRLHVPSHARGLAWVPQQQLLLPHLTVAENVAFGLPRSERAPTHPRVRALLDAFGLTALASAPAPQLSGGERQRVALARALAVQPRLLLLDEPFSALDRPRREAQWALLREQLSVTGTPAVFVTHDAREARALADRVTVFERGRTVRSGTPQELLATPS